MTGQAMTGQATPRAPFLLVLALVQAGTVQPGTAWTFAEMEEFLRSAKILSMRPVGSGITKPMRATFSDGRRSHDVHIQFVDIYKERHETSDGVETNFRDSYKYNIAAYRLNRLLDLDMVPVCVDRTVNEKPSAVSWWIEDVLGTELDRINRKLEPPDVPRWDFQNYRVRVFDQLIYNTDRNRSNLLITKSWRVWMIDHTRAFRLQHTLMNEARLLDCDRFMLDHLRALDRATVERQLSPWLTTEEIDALMARRDLIVAHYRQRPASVTRTPPAPSDETSSSSPVISGRSGRTRKSPVPSRP